MILSFPIPVNTIHTIPAYFFSSIVFLSFINIKSDISEEKREEINIFLPVSTFHSVPHWVLKLHQTFCVFFLYLEQLAANGQLWGSS